MEPEQMQQACSEEAAQAGGTQGAPPRRTPRWALSVTAVSYTHLDVYKRQLLGCCTSAASLPGKYGIPACHIIPFRFITPRQQMPAVFQNRTLCYVISIAIRRGYFKQPTVKWANSRIYTAHFVQYHGLRQRTDGKKRKTVCTGALSARAFLEKP